MRSLPLLRSAGLAQEEFRETGGAGDRRGEAPGLWGKPVWAHRREIDAPVYELYGLTEEEIAIVEEAQQ
ncbi:MAG TPA: hypothetical protein VMW58_07005 [Anaerolineae bacterium]|nr:hypothetical protein [Anaerolineae bacterium]